MRLPWSKPTIRPASTFALFSSYARTPASITVPAPSGEVSEAVQELDALSNFPIDRMEIAHAPFAQLVTDPPELAEQAWDHYRENRHRPTTDRLMDILRDAQISCPPIEQSHQFRNELGTPPWDKHDDRLRWICDHLRLDQFAAETTRRNILTYQNVGFREVEVLGDSEHCTTCRSGFATAHPVDAIIVIPHRECDRPYNCAAAVVAVIN